MLCNVSLNTPITCSLVCLPGMTSSLANVNKSSGAHFLALFLKFPNCLMFLNIGIDLHILKTYYGQFTLTTQKSLHIIFKSWNRCVTLKVTPGYWSGAVWQAVCQFLSLVSSNNVAILNVSMVLSLSVYTTACQLTFSLHTMGGIRSS